MHFKEFIGIEMYYTWSLCGIAGGRRGSFADQPSPAPLAEPPNWAVITWMSLTPSVL